MGISTEAQQNIAKSLDSATSASGAEGVPGLVFYAVDKNGEALASHASGKRVAGGDERMDMETTFWIASCTKMITGIACMQLVEQGKLSLDKPVYDILPELKDIQCLDEQAKLVPRKGDITLKMLLTHTAGFGYSFFNERLCKYARPAGFDEFSVDTRDYVLQPLVNQPGSRWEYGVNIDWAGQMVERVTKMTLGEYFEQHIFAPLDVKNTTFFPTDSMQSNFAYQHQRATDGSVTVRDHIARRALTVRGDHDKKHIFNSGGGGLFSSPREYCKIIAMLLNDGKSPTTGKTLLKPETVQEMFTNQIKEFPHFGTQGIPAVKPLETNPIPSLYPQEGNPPQGWGLTFMITEEPGATGRARNTAFWGGLANNFWWADRERGVGGMIAGQILPFGDAVVMGQWGACEATVYAGMGKEKVGEKAAEQIEAMKA